MYVCDYLDGIHDIQDKMPCIALTPFKHENGRLEQPKVLWTDFQKLDSSLATQRTKTSYDAKPLLGASTSMLETQATERLYKDAPPVIPMIIMYPISYR
jgi:hypothetical protein